MKYRKLLDFKFLVVPILSILLIFGCGLKVYSETSSLPQRSIISVDSGRKYTSVNEFKEIIDKAYANGYSSIQIHLGNDGLRLLLDDMSLSVNNKNYSSESVKEAIQYGNEQYYNDPNGSFLTQSEMDSVISYATERSIEVIPVVNSPGHMDAILKAMEKLGIEKPSFKSSVRTVDLNNEEAVSFTKALIKKYVAYFAPYSKIFNFGFDEYANDVKEGGGWKAIQASGEYKKFVVYANEMSNLAKTHGLQPMAYNDGIYYNSKNEFGTFNPDIIVSYWTSGWGGYDVAPAEFLINKGHKILNTNDAWYWVLGRMNVSDGYYHFGQSTKGIETNPFNKITGSYKELPTIGSMMATWADVPSNNLDLKSLGELMEKFSKKNNSYFDMPANYSEVDKEIASIPKDLTIYTEESVNQLKNHMPQVNRFYRVSDQSIVNGYADSIRILIERLEIKPADYTNVERALEEVRKLNPKDYSNFDIVKETIQSIKRDLDVTYQSQVDLMAENVLSAFQHLVKVEPKPTPRS